MVGAELHPTTTQALTYDELMNEVVGNCLISLVILSIPCSKSNTARAFMGKQRIKNPFWKAMLAGGTAWRERRA